MAKTCFVIMAIGDTKIGSKKVSSSDLKSKYDDLIKEAIKTAYPGIEVYRADEGPKPGAITNDILTRLMHSDFVVADISYPNPNVFYELGIRHACRTGTVLIREASKTAVPFDISHLRHIEFQNTPSGLKKLSAELRRQFEWFEQNPKKPDNSFLELAQLTKYEFLDFGGGKKQPPPEAAAMMFGMMMKNPKLMKVLTDNNIPSEEKGMKMLAELGKNPDAAMPLLEMMAKSGLFTFEE